jgi:hypothetical protein
MSGIRRNTDALCPPALKAEAVEQHVNELCSRWVLSHNAGPMYWLRRWTKTFNFRWERDGLQPEAPFPYRPFADRKIDLRSLPFPHDFTAADPPDYIDILMGFLMFTKDMAKHDELWIVRVYLARRLHMTYGEAGQSRIDYKTYDLKKASEYPSTTNRNDAIKEITIVRVPDD